MLSTVGIILGIIALSALGFVGLWCGICYGLALVAGWPRLCELYALDQGFAGPTTTFSGYVGVTRYRGALTGGATPAGLYLNVAFPFRLGAGPVFIPWQDISVLPPSTGLFPLVTFDFPKAGTRLRVPESVASHFTWQRAAVQVPSTI